MNTNSQFPPNRGSLRGTLIPQKHAVLRSRTTPISTAHVVQEHTEEKVTLADIGDFSAVDRESGYSPIPSLVKIESTPMRQWTSSSVAIWMNNLGEQCASYSKLLREKQISGSVLVSITSDTLEALGVKQSAVRQWIIASRDITLAKQAVTDLKI